LGSKVEVKLAAFQYTGSCVLPTGRVSENASFYALGHIRGGKRAWRYSPRGLWKGHQMLHVDLKFKYTSTSRPVCA